jgi:hypothetical protein
MNDKGRSIWLGLATGSLLLLLFSLPFLWRNYQVQKTGLIKQSSLTLAAGDGQAAMQSDYLLVSQKTDNQAEQPVSVSLTGRHWYHLAQGNVSLPYDRQLHHQVHVASGNRQVTIPINMQALPAQTIEANINLAPNAKPLVFFEPSANQNKVSFSTQGADTLQIDPQLPGVQASLDNNAVHLAFDQSLGKHHFFSFRVILENPHGRAVTTVAVLPQSEEPSTPIHNAQELQAISLNPGGCYHLANDIDLQGFPWQPIGSVQTPFFGVLDGKGYAIKGLTYPGNSVNKGLGYFSLFHICRHAVIRNIRVIAPEMDSTKESIGDMSLSTLTNSFDQSLMENCAVFGGYIKSNQGSASSLVTSAGDSVLLHLFNSAKIEVLLPGDVMINSGGITGTLAGFMAYCANEGPVEASHLTGGLFGFGPKSSTWRCINSGTVQGAVFIGRFPSGAFLQTMGDYYLSDCAFIKGSAARAGSVFDRGCMSNIQVIDPDDLQNKEALTLLGAFEGEDTQWILKDPDAKGPLPSGIRTLKNYRPGGDGCD